MARSGITKAQRRGLLERARNAALNADARFSNFRVGAAVLTRQGNVFTGCNVENETYGLTMCAERSAIFTAVGVEGPSSQIQAIAVVCADPKKSCSPCGACRQVIFERGAGAIVYFRHDLGDHEETIETLLPWGFRLT